MFFAKNQINQTARRLIIIYTILLATLLLGLLEMTILALTGADPATAVSAPWKLLAFNLMMVLVFMARYARPYLLAPPQPQPKPQPTTNPIEIERERIERWAKRGL